jgi:uncharacterized membrane protein YccC
MGAQSSMSSPRSSGSHWKIPHSRIRSDPSFQRHCAPPLIQFRPAFAGLLLLNDWATDGLSRSHHLFFLSRVIASVINPATRSTAVRLTLASVLAMSIATAGGIDNPWWAAMAVWMIGQPPRGLLIERSVAQLLGTLAGAAAGTLLMRWGSGSPTATLLGLAAWIALCCAVANAMRHQRAYGAALCGLTCTVIVTLTLNTNIDAGAFALARALDNIIGICAALGIAIVMGPVVRGPELAGRTRPVISQALRLIADALTEERGRTFARERAFLVSLAALEASAEDAVAGSFSARRRLGELNALLAQLLDLVVVARAIRSRDAPALAPEHRAMSALRNAFDNTAVCLANEGVLDLRPLHAATHHLQAFDPMLAPVLDEMRLLLGQMARGYERLQGQARADAMPPISLPHPDLAMLRLATVRGALVTVIAGFVWLLLDVEPFRYLLLGASIFIVLFSMLDEPAAVVRQVFIGGACAAVPAALWRLAVMPEISDGWLSLLLAVPVVFVASLLQARKGTVFIGLSFNMLFAVLARPVDLRPSLASEVLTSQILLLAGIALSYSAFRWFVPMSMRQRRLHLRAAVRREVAAISIRAATPWAARHLARLRHIVFGLALRSGGLVQEAEDALAALSLGHALVRIGDMQDLQLSPMAREAAKEILQLTRLPMTDPGQAGRRLHALAERIAESVDGNEVTSPTNDPQLCWLLELASLELREHASIFATALETAP